MTLRLVDQRGRLFGLINLVDLGVIVLILALAGAGAYKVLAIRRGPVRVPRDIDFTMLVQEVRQATVDVVHEGDFVWDYDSSLPFGTIKAIQVLPATKHASTSDGRWVLTELPERYDLVLTVRAQALVSDAAIVVGRMEIRIGTKVTIKTRNYAIETRVTGIKELLLLID
jgi:hypothetical protein